MVAAAEVVDLFTTTHAQEQIDTYRLAMARGEQFPPVSVIRIGPRFVIADGHKRLRACRALGARQIPVELWPLSKLLADQLRQFRHKTREIATVVVRAARHPEGRKDARRLYWDTVGHWKRIALAAASRGRRLAGFGAPPEQSAAPVLRRLMRDCLQIGRAHV